MIDLGERERAIDPSRSFIVQAPAGSGKTGLLTQRFLRLLAVVERPESVVAVTFTRKAAAEMRDRIFDALRAAANGAAVQNEYEQHTRRLALDTLARNAARGWNLLMDPSRLQVYTIDALCSFLTHQMPVTSGFGGHMNVLEDAADLYRMAARRTLRMLTEGNEDSQELFRSVVTYFDNNAPALEEQIVRMLQKRDQWQSLRSGEHPDLVKRFRRLLDEAHKALREVFREQRVVDFSEITQAAIHALGSPEKPSDLLYWLDYRIEHLLVDEFQDTSRAQYNLLEALTAQWSAGDEHSLFLVGDPMQSIYRFREAEVALFLRCWDEQALGAVSLERVTLATNFRCTPEILEWVQEQFGRAMSIEDRFAGAVRFRPSQADRPAGGNAPQCCCFVNDDGRREAAQVVDLVRQAQPEGSVAILVRSRNHLAEILPALREAHIDYEAVEIDRLTDQQHVIDVIALTRAILHLSDRASWLACLRAPWCGLTVADLCALAEGEPDRTILDLISDPGMIARLSPDGRFRAVRAQEILSAAVQKAGRVRLRNVVEEAWIALGGPAVLPQKNEFEDVETVLGLIEAEEQSGTTMDFGLLAKRLEKLYAKPAVAPNCVQVMTIFQAKGLEFDTVILPQLSRKTQRLDKDLLIWTEELGEDGLPQLRIAAMPQTGKEDQQYREVRDALKAKEEHELKRVFYVACTRARNRLYLLGSAKSKKDGRECQKAGEGTFLKIIWDSVSGEFEKVLRRTTSTAQKSELRQAPKTILRRLPRHWQAPQFERSVDWQQELREAAASTQNVTYEWAKGAARYTGTVVHRLLNRICSDGIEKWNAERLRSSERMIASELLLLGVARDDVKKAVSKVVAAVKNALETERGRWILSPHANSRSEYQIAGRIKDQLVSGAIDRIFRDADGRLWIIDYKTGEHKGGNRETFLNEEQRRYRPQLENYAALISRMEQGPISLGLYFPLLDGGWREWEFAEEAALTA